MGCIAGGVLLFGRPFGATASLAAGAERCVSPHAQVDEGVQRASRSAAMGAERARQHNCVPVCPDLETLPEVLGKVCTLIFNQIQQPSSSNDACKYKDVFPLGPDSAETQELIPSLLQQSESDEEVAYLLHPAGSSEETALW